jgi:tetratricopeptide (TPR) repeat protein
LERTGRLAEAEQEYRSVISEAEKLATDVTSAPQYQGQLAVSIHHLANLMRAARPIEAAQAARRAIAILQELPDPASRQIRAWSLATSPFPQLRDPQTAVRLARKALEEWSGNCDWWITLGVAHYRAGEWKEAIEALEKSMQLGAGDDPSTGFFLAMAWWRKGVKDQARSWYDKAVQGIEKKKSLDEELFRFRAETPDEEFFRFRAEAAALLGVTDHPKSTGKKEENAKQRSRP